MNIPNAQQMHNENSRGQPSRAAKKASKAESRVSRTDIRYWRKRVKKAYRDGYQSPFYSVQIAYKGQRMRFPLETGEKEAAADKARLIYCSLLSNGWDATLAKYKPETAKPTRTATVGALIEAVGERAGIREVTLNEYSMAFRTIVSQIENIQESPKLDKDGNPRQKKDGTIILQSRFDAHTGGRDAWVNKVDQVPLQVLTPERVQRWRLDYLAKAGNAPDDKKKAANTLNRILRNARSLFSSKALQFVKDKVALPSPLPFEGIKLEPRSSTTYRSRIDADRLIKQAVSELGSDPAKTEEFKLFCLCLLCGLRRREADTLLWSQIDLDKRILTIETTEYLRPKSEDSNASVDLDEDMVALLRSWREQTTGKFVVESHITPGKATHRTCYRCKQHMDSLIAWLRSKDVQAQKPLHELRKEIGSIIASRDGIFAAQRFLRHGNALTTSLYYADKKARITSGLSIALAATTDDTATGR